MSSTTADALPADIHLSTTSTYWADVTVNRADFFNEWELLFLEKYEYGRLELAKKLPTLYQSTIFDQKVSAIANLISIL